MKRQIIAVALGSLFALPAFAMDRDEPYNEANYAPSVSASKPRDALVTEQRKGERDALVAEQRKGEAVPTIEEGRSIN